MMPILKKSKEMAKQLREKGITPNFRRPTNPSFSSRNNGMMSHRGRGGMNHHMDRMDRRPSSLRGGHRKLFLTKRLNNNGPLNKKPMFNRMIPMKGHPGHRFGGSATAAAEAYVADYMRTMQHQLPPMPYAPPHDFQGFGSSMPPALPRYYDGIPSRIAPPIIPDYPPPALPNRNQPSSSSNFDKRSYDEFVWKNKNRNGPNSRNSRDDKHRSYRR